MFRAIVIGILLAGPASAADGEFVLKLYRAKAGDKYEVETTTELRSELTAQWTGKPTTQRINLDEKETFTAEILEAKDGEKTPTRQKRTYSTSWRSDRVFGAIERNQPAHGGKTVLIEKKGDRFEFRIDDKAVTASDAPDLVEGFTRQARLPGNQDFLPGDPVKVGATWTVPADKAAKMFAAFAPVKMRIDARKSTITGKLVKVYKKSDADFGTIELTTTIALSGYDLDGLVIPLKDGSKAVVVTTLDACIDGTAKGETSKSVMTLDATGRLPNNGTLTITGKTTATETIKPATK